MDYFNYRRRRSSVVSIGNTPLGGIHPIRIQSMATVSTMDTEAAVNQAIRLIKAGAAYVRFTAQGEREADNLRNIRNTLIKEGYDTPLIADVHFNPHVAEKAATIVEKVRINPGNYIDKAFKPANIAFSGEVYTGEIQKIRERFIPLLELCRKNNTTLRIGVNHGSLSDRIMNRYGDTPEGMVESCMEFLRLCVEEKFNRVVVSMKASNTVVMIRAVRLLVRTMEAEGMYYPLHLGVTEAGDGEDGRIKSAAGIGALLADGIGDTIRVSLSEEPEAEIPVAQKLVDYIASLENYPPVNASASPRYNPIAPTKRKSRTVAGIGGENPPVVISCRTDDAPADDNAVNESLQPDWIYTASRPVSEKPSHHPVIVDAKNWRPQQETFPLFTAAEKNDISQYDTAAKFITLTYNDLTDEIIQLLKTDTQTVAIVDSSHPHYIGEVRAFMHRLLAADCDVPVIFMREYDDTDIETVQVKAAVEFGTLLTDGFGDGIMTYHKKTAICDVRTLENCMFSILQATRVRISKTEYISCPGCGRTLFDLQKTIAQVKSATSHMKGLKIGIMGCIVNGPGEMADADFGYVGAGRGHINLYKGKTCVLKNIPEKEAVTKLLEVINQSEN